jgi:hypothetical protein
MARTVLFERVRVSKKHFFFPIGMGYLFFADNLYVNCQVVRDEIATGMQLLGARKVSELRPEMIEVLDGLLGKQLKDSDASVRLE